jgi:chromosome condensin MukBEF complex kleisin-like MukF subunit
MKEQFVILNLIFKCQLKLNQVKMRKEMDIFMRRSKIVLWTSTRLGLFRVDYQGLQPEWVVTRNFNRVK